MNIQDCEHNQITTYGIDHLGKGMFVCKDCGILLKLVSVSDLATSDRCIAELEKRLAAAESRIAELVKGIQQAMEELTETGTCHETLEKLIEVE